MVLSTPHPANVKFGVCQSFLGSADVKFGVFCSSFQNSANVKLDVRQAIDVKFGVCWPFQGSGNVKFGVSWPFQGSTICGIALGAFWERCGSAVGALWERCGSTVGALGDGQNITQNVKKCVFPIPSQ